MVLSPATGGKIGMEEHDTGGVLGEGLVGIDIILGLTV